MGNQGVIGPGDVQWMTAGSGIIHQEMPKGDEKGYMGGFQLWANLPASSKMMDPRYRDVKKKQIPEITTPDGAKIRIICGEVNGKRGPVQDIVTDPEYLDITVPAGTEFKHPTRAGYTVLAYVIEGQARFCREENPFQYDVEGVNYFDLQRKPYISNESLILFEDGDMVAVDTDAESVRFLLISGQPIREPVAWYGPIVMNTPEELETAFAEFNNGTFIKQKTSKPKGNK
jgi:quercetin 2,3-dioxygenase